MWKDFLIVSTTGLILIGTLYGQSTDV